MEFYIANKDEFSNWRVAILLGLFVTDTIFYLHIETTHLSNRKEEEKLQEIWSSLQLLIAKYTVWLMNLSTVMGRICNK